MPVDEGLAWLEGLLRAEPENRTLDANLSGFVTVLEAMSGRVDEARRHIAETRALARDLGLIWQAGVQELLSGYVELLAGDPVAAERDMRTAAQVFREIGEGWFLSTVAVDLPRAVYEQGRYDDAMALLDDIDEVPAPTDREWQIKRTGVPARLLARRGRLDEAEQLARQGVALGADCEFVGLHADVLLDLAEVLRLAGREEEAAATTGRGGEPVRAQGQRGGGPERAPIGGVALAAGAARPLRRGRERLLELRAELGVEEGERELVVADQVDELLRLVDLGQVAALPGPDRALGRGDVVGDQVVGGDPLAELRAVDAGVIELVDDARTGARRRRRPGPSRSSAGCRSSAGSPRGAGRRTGAGRRARRSCAPASR